jgi:hypothetical protein
MAVLILDCSLKRINTHYILIGMSTNWVTPKQYAELHGFKKGTVLRWLQKGLLRGAKKKMAFTGHYYLVPESARPPQLKRGPQKRAQASV